MNRKIFSVSLLLILCIFLSFLYQNASVFFQIRRLPIYSVATEEKKVAITFDTSWGDDNTEQILDTLNKNNIKATFFVIGKWAEDFPQKVIEIDKSGNEIGNHSYMHPNMTYMNAEKINSEINLTDAKILQLTGHTTKVFRCPSGEYNDLVITTVENSEHYCIQWDVDSIDWMQTGADIEYERVMNKTKNGSIILFHTNAKYTPQNLSKIIKALQNKGFKFVTVSDLIYKSNYRLNNEGKQFYN